MIKNVLSELNIKPNKDSLEYADKLILTNVGYYKFSKFYKKSKALKESEAKNDTDIVNDESNIVLPENLFPINESLKNSTSDQSKSYFHLKQSYFSKSFDEDKISHKQKLGLLPSSKSFDKDSDCVSDSASCISGERTLDRNLMNNLMTELKRMKPYLSKLVFD
jgi:hypothetical protein